MKKERITILILPIQKYNILSLHQKKKNKTEKREIAGNNQLWLYAQEGKSYP